MKTKIIIIIALFALTQSINGQFQKDRVCASSRHADECNQLQRGNSEVACTVVQDAIECAQQIRNGTAEFGVFSAENAYHIAALGWDGLTVIKEIRHNEKLHERFDFQSVAIVRSDHIGGLPNLRGVNFCHPGLHYGRHERWTERFLKQFERSLVQPNCSFDGSSAAEQEVAAMADFFDAACRPGAWSNNPHEDLYLKEKYPRLCALCDDQEKCTYQDPLSSNNHRQALDCLRKTGNSVTYVALQEAQDFFTTNSDIAIEYSFLCPNGSLQSIDGNVRPCVWLSQPWKVVISSNEKAISLAKTIENWMRANSGWEAALRQILTPDSHSVVGVSAIVRLPDYVTPIRPIPIAIENPCPAPIRWCTQSYEAMEKCQVLRMAALTTGIVPNIVCNDHRSDTVSCISDVSANKADLVGIDSNFGYLARNPYNLTGALFEETELEKYSSVVAVIKEKDIEKITRFEDFQGKRACFGEFGGIASIAFINIAKGRGIFKREDCEFGKLLGGYFGDSCFPGSRSVFHDPTASNPESLCTLCQTHYQDTTTTSLPLIPMAERVHDDEESEQSAIEGADDDSQNIPFIPNRSINCAAAPTNRFYGTRGALACLNEIGEVAVIEHQNLRDHAEALKLNPNDFRIVCRNGSLAAYPGFNVDSACFLTTIVDGEVVVRRNSDKNLGIVNALLSLDKYLQNDPDFKMYNVFNGVKNLLFEDSSLGLVSPNDTAVLSQSVKNYIQLFEDVENCIEETGGAQSVAINILLTLSLVLFTTLIRN